jgi:hypothetical protein
MIAPYDEQALDSINFLFVQVIITGQQSLPPVSTSALPVGTISKVGGFRHLVIIEMKGCCGFFFAWQQLVSQKKGTP